MQKRYLDNAFLRKPLFIVKKQIHTGDQTDINKVFLYWQDK